MGKLVNIQLCMNDGEKVLSYQGRCLGFVTPEEFNAVVHKGEIFRKLFGVETKSIKELNRDHTENLRIAFALKTREGKEENRKVILFTSPLEFVSEVGRGGNSAFINTKNKEFLIMEEVSDE